jgi:hypothetical protein
MVGKAVSMRSMKTIIGIIFALLLLLGGIVSSAETGPGKTYTNPVLVETFSNPRFGIMGIGDPAVVFYQGRY